MKTVSYSAVVVRLLVDQRQIKGIEQADMAAKLGLTPSSYSRLEAGHTALTVDMMFRMASILNINIPQLMQSAENVIRKFQHTPGVEVAPITRSNTIGNEQNNGVAPFVTGAALGALIAAILSK